MIIVLLTTCFLAPPLTAKLPGKPLHLMLSNHGQRLWITYLEGSFSLNLGSLSNQGFKRVALPAETKWVVPHPDKDLLYLGTDSALLTIDIKTEAKSSIPISWNETYPPPAWRPGTLSGDLLFIPSLDGVHIMTLQGDHKFLAFDRLPNLNPNSVQLPEIVLLGKKPVWFAAQTVYQHENQKLVRSEMPPTHSMEQAIPILGLKGELDWFIHGGNQGDLSSFGWRIRNRKLSERGILTRFAQDIGKGRVFFTTVSNQVSSHLYASLWGKRVFKLWVAVQKDSKWSLIEEREIHLKKGEGTFGVFWPGDGNGDGFLDMVVCDKRQGFKLYASRPDGRFEESGKDLGSVPDELMFLKHGLAWAYQRSNGWELHWQK